MLQWLCNDLFCIELSLHFKIDAAEVMPAGWTRKAGNVQSEY